MVSLFKLSFIDTLNWILNDAWATIIIVSIISLVVIAIAFLGTYSLRELKRINDAFAAILLCETEVELPKSVALDVVNSAFHSSVAEHFVVDIYSSTKDDWVKLIIRGEDEDRKDSDRLIATATEKNFCKVLLTYLL